MAISLYDLSVTSYLQNLAAVAGLLDKAQAHFAQAGVDVEEIVETALHPTMKPFRFQIRSIVHHSQGTIAGLRAGTFSPPGGAPALGYAELRQLVAEGRAAVEATTREEIESLADREVVFAAGEYRLPFTATNFILSFSLPNFYFHATTAYDILRMKGVPLEKRDYLGRLRFERVEKV